MIQRRAEESGGAPAAAVEDSDSDEEGDGEAGGADTQVFLLPEHKVTVAQKSVIEV